MATFMERLAFLQKVPTLMKATADDDAPCPGYLFQEIGKMSHESPGGAQCLLEYLLERLQVESCHVKLKVLKIFLHLCGHASTHFLTELRRNSTFIQQASVYSGAPDPVHGTALHQKVRTAAQEVARLLFTDAFSTKGGVRPLGTAQATMGMGSATSHRSAMQGFGYSPGKQATGADSILEKLQKAAEVVASAVLPPTEQQGIRLHDNHYRAVAAPPAAIEVAVPACAYNLPACGTKAAGGRSPGQVGGGWEETDSGNSSSHNSSQDVSADRRASAGSRSAGTGSQSGASRESGGDLSERVEALQAGDCGQEVALISSLTLGTRVFLSRDESQHFIKQCSTLNCEVVVELLCCKLQDPSLTVTMRALSAVSCLMTSDLLSLERTLGATQGRLRQLSAGAPGPVANKATKILRQLEALTGGGRQDGASGGLRPAGGDLEAGSGDLEAAGGGPRPAGGDLEAGSGDLEAAGGDLQPAGGDLRPAGGDLRPAEADLEAGSGDLLPAGGDLEAAGGGLRPAGGDLEAAGGDLEAAGGDLEAAGGDLEAGSGDLLPAGGDLEAAGGDLEAGSGDLRPAGGDLDPPRPVGSERRRPTRPSLFSGMELVTSARRQREPPSAAAAKQEAPPVCQTVSAFSFLNS